MYYVIYKCNMCDIYVVCIFICICDIHIVLCKYYIFFPIFQLSCPYLYPSYLHPLILFQKIKYHLEAYTCHLKGHTCCFDNMCYKTMSHILCGFKNYLHTHAMTFFSHNVEKSWAGVFTALPWFAFPFGSCHDDVITTHIVRK